MSDFGGLIRFTYDGASIKIRARIGIEPGDFSFAVEHNQDGSFDRYLQPMGPTFKVEFVDSKDGVSAVSFPWNQVMAGGPYKVSILEDSTGVIHNISGAKFSGRADIDRLKGVVSGVVVQGAVGAYTLLTA